MFKHLINATEILNTLIINFELKNENLLQDLSRRFLTF